MIDPSRLVFLQGVHRHGSVVAAARVLGYTPSAVSQQIGKLEREAGTTLLESAGRGVVLTDAALVLVEAAEAVRAATEVAQARLEALAGELTGSLHVACLPSAVRGVAAPALGVLAAQAPDLDLHLRELDPEDAVEALSGGRVDVALVSDWTHSQVILPAGLHAEHLTDDPVDLVVPAGHPLAGEESVDLAATADEIWATDASQGIGSRRIVEGLRAHAGHPRLNYYVEEYASQVALVAAGLCVCVLPRLGRLPLPETVRVVGLRGSMIPTRRFIAVHRHSRDRRPAIQRFVDAVRDQLTAQGLPVTVPEASS
jgi:molybdate transport repressor ModE-like protein